mgnify:CR=1 FL=1
MADAEFPTTPGGYARAVRWARELGTVQLAGVEGTSCYGMGLTTALQGAGIDYDSAEATFLPSVTVPLDEDGARKMFRLIESLEDSDDVQNVYANFDVSDEVMEAVG